MTILYCVNKEDLSVGYAGLLPETWKTATGLNALPADSEAIKDLSWAGLQEGFVTQEEAIELGVSLAVLEQVLAAGAIPQAAAVRKQRQDLLAKTVDTINPIRWQAMSAEEKQICIDFRQALMDISTQPDFPWTIDWPAVPALFASAL